MKSIKTIVILSMAAGFASVSFAASETVLTPVPKTEEAIQASAAMSAREAAKNTVKPAAKTTKQTGDKAETIKKHKTKTGHTKTGHTKTAQTKSGHAKAGHIKVGHTKAGHAKSGHATTKHTKAATAKH